MIEHITWAAYANGRRVLWGSGPKSPEDIANTVRAEGHADRDAVITVKRVVDNTKMETTIHKPKAKAA